ncbi:aldo/keto reductase [candidate division KSB1 bacterium]
MTERKDNRISRQDFLRRSTRGLLGIGLLGGAPAVIRSRKALAQGNVDLRTLGRSGIKVSAVGYGASRTMEPSLVGRALDMGINFLDTGPSYYSGQNEIMVGQVTRERRKDVVIQSKIVLRVREKGEEMQSEAVAKRVKKFMQSSLDKSLKSLQTDYIDIILLHGISQPAIMNLPVVQQFLADAKKKGVIRAHGLSAHGNQVDVLAAVVEGGFYDVVMVPYNHRGSYNHMLSGSFSEWDQPGLEEEMRKAEEAGIGLVAMKGASGGPLSPGGGGGGQADLPGGPQVDHGSLLCSDHGHGHG